jgi:hypothetical protein
MNTKVDHFKEACKGFDILYRLCYATQHALIGRTVPYSDLAVARLRARCKELGISDEDVADLVVCMGGAVRALLDAGLIYQLPIPGDLLDEDLRKLGLKS